MATLNIAIPPSRGNREASVPFPADTLKNSDGRTHATPP